MPVKKWFGKTSRQSAGNGLDASWPYTVTITSGTVSSAVCRRFGRVVTLNLELESVPAANSFAQIGSIPSTVAPGSDVGCCPNGSMTTWLKVTSAGEIQLYSANSTTLPAVRASLSWIL